MHNLIFYSEDNHRLSKNIPHTIIHGLDDIFEICICQLCSAFSLKCFLLVI